MKKFENPELEIRVLLVENVLNGGSVEQEIPGGENETPDW